MGILERYCEWVHRRVFGDNEAERPLHAIIGLVEELSELDEELSCGNPDKKNAILELGDALWYWVATAVTFGHDYSEVQTMFNLAEVRADPGLYQFEKLKQSPMYGYVKRAITLMGSYKKHHFYKVPFTLKDSTTPLTFLLSGILTACNHIGVPWQSVLIQNVKKLEAKYPASSYPNATTFGHYDEYGSCYNCGTYAVTLESQGPMHRVECANCGVTGPKAPNPGQALSLWQALVQKRSDLSESN